ncbi:MAG: hypothetical protein BWY51_00433 [Parcubacteria group bacterium ADurb.Bin316]|nr:MAG: hypothetical protein BWY51_00433 [Parcubacteria group bacterium ADurb.Bin316]
MDNFQKTVNLKDKAEKERQRMLYGEPEKNNKKSKAEGIDEVYRGSSSSEDNLKKISRPIVKKINEGLWRNLIFILTVILVLATIYFLFFRQSGDQAEKNGQVNWYAVKLQNGEMYYGQIDNTAADPVIIKNVYYDYDMLNKTDKETGAAGNLRLVKKGKETYGPSGVMEVVRSNVVYMDILKEDSKVLKAILDYENKNK